MTDRININTKRYQLIIYLLLIVITFAVFWQVNEFEFTTYDDQAYVTENLNIQSGLTWEGVSWAFTTKYFGLWNPLVWLSLMADYQLFGLKAGGYHLTNLIFHILSTLLLFRLFHRMTKEIWKSAFVAAMFALHPLHVESVAWIAERKDVLSAFFWMLTLCFYIYYTERPAVKRYLLVFFSFVLALMSKPMVVTLPVVMILLDYWPLKRFELKKGNVLVWQLKEKIPLFILSAAVSFITLYAPQSSSAGYYPLSSRVANAIVSFVRYLEKTFWPHDLAVFYPFSIQIPTWLVIGAILVIVVITTSAIVMVKRFPYLFVGWFWYVITIAPVMGIIQIGNYAMADRYHYLPSIGITIILAWGIPSLFKTEEIRMKIILTAGVIFISIMTTIAWRQCAHWKNSATLFQHALLVTKNNYLAHNSMGLAMFTEGKNQVAIDNFSRAISIRPDYVRSYNNRGLLYVAIGQYKKAMEDYNKAINMKPDIAEIYNNRGILYSIMGMYQRALIDYNEAIRLKPYYYEAYNNRGFNYFKIDMYQQAMLDFNEAIRIKPTNSLFYYNRAMLYFKQGNNKLGCLDAQKVCELGNCSKLEEAKTQGFCP